MANSGFNQGQTGNASEVSSGVVQQATDQQVADKVDVGATGAPLFVVPSKIPTESIIETPFLAAENIAAGDAVALQTFNEFQNVATIDYRSTSTSYLIDEPIPHAQAITLPNDGRTSYAAFQVRNTGSSTPSWTVSIRATLTGPDLAFTSGSGNGVTITVDVSAIVFVPGNTYYIIYTETGGAADSQWYGQALVGGGGYIWNGAAYVSQDIRYDVYLYYIQQTKVAYEMVKASAASLTNQSMNMVGFSTTAVTAGDPVTVSDRPILEGSGFTPDVMYYLSNTPGLISATPGSVTREIGRAISATRILRKRGSVSPIIATGSLTACCAFTFGVNSGNSGTINGAASGTYGGPFINAGDVVSNAGGIRLRIYDKGSIL